MSGLVALLVVGALGCLAWLAWLARADLARPSVPPVYASSADVQSYAPNAATWITASSPAPGLSSAAAPAAAPVMAYSEPPQGIRRGTFVPPIGGYVSQLFGPTSFTLEPALTYHGVHYQHFHTGIDIDAQAGTPVAASAAGTVVQVGVWNGQASGYGNFVMIEHPQGYITLYGHLETVTVTVGESVRQLQLIGYVGSTGLSTGPHVHFEIRRFGDFLDPLPYLLGRVRASW